MYNRGSRAISRQFDREERERRVVASRHIHTYDADHHCTGCPLKRNQCERCHRSLGVRLDRGCIWDAYWRRWVDACRNCRSDILMLNRTGQVDWVDYAKGAR